MESSIRGGKALRTIVYGNSNQAGDRFSKGRLLPQLQPGTIITMHNTGAYGFSRSGNFNEHVRPIEILNDGNKFHVIREKESMEALTSNVPKEPIPDGRKSARPTSP